MADFAFEFDGVVKRCRDYAMRQSVLWPVTRRRSLRSSSVLADAKRLLGMWRWQATALRGAGWAELRSEGKLQFCRNCPPSLAVVSARRRARRCGVASVCPWCYARSVGDVFDLFAQFLPERGFSQDGLRLVEVRSRRLFAPREVGTHLDAALRNWRRVPKNALRMLSPLGAYYAITIAPRRGKSAAWQLSSRVLAVVPGGWAMPAGLDNGVRTVNDTSVRSRSELIPVVARTCRYQSGLLTAPADYVAMALNARSRIRCSATSGCLRRKK